MRLTWRIYYANRTSHDFGKGDGDLLTSYSNFFFWTLSFFTLAKEIQLYKKLFDCRFADVNFIPLTLRNANLRLLQRHLICTADGTSRVRAGHLKHIWWSWSRNKQRYPRLGLWIGSWISYKRHRYRQFWKQSAIR